MRIAGSMLLILIGLSGVSMANGVESPYPDNTARALGRAGAVVAGVNDPSAIYFNPAGLAGLTGYSVLVSVNLVFLTHTFQPAPSTVKAGTRRLEYGQIEHDGSPFIAPFIAGHFEFEALPALDFGYGIYGPSAHGQRSFPNQLPTRSLFRSADNKDVSDEKLSTSSGLRPNGMLIDVDLFLAYATLSAAWQPHSNWRVGISLQNALFNSQLSQGIGGAAPAVVELDVSDYFNPTGIIGVHYTPHPSIELGLSIRPPFTVLAEGTAQLKTFGCPAPPCTQPQPLDTYPIDGQIDLQDSNGRPDERVTFEFNQPLIVRMGVRYVDRTASKAERFDVELDYLYQMHSVHDAYRVNFLADRIQLPGENGQGVVLDGIPEIVDQRNYVDSHGLRLGGAWAVLPKLLTVRAGGSIETGASPEAYTHIDFPGLDQWSLAAGLGVTLGAFELDLGYTYTGSVERTVEDSDVRLIDITNARENWLVIGNGTFTSHHHVLGVSMIWAP